MLGHKEPPIAEARPTALAGAGAEAPTSPISVLKTFIENENIKLQELNLFDVAAIPAEMKTIMIVGPAVRFFRPRDAVAARFLEQTGRILLLLDPAAKTPKLHAFLNELGVRVNDDRLMAMVRTGHRRSGAGAGCDWAISWETSPITKRLAEVRAPFLGGDLVRSTLEPRSDQGANIQTSTAGRRRKKVIGARSITIQMTDNALQFDQDRDHDAPLTIAALDREGR